MRQIHYLLNEDGGKLPPGFSDIETRFRDWIKMVRKRISPTSGRGPRHRGPSRDILALGDELGDMLGEPELPTMNFSKLPCHIHAIQLTTSPGSTSHFNPGLYDGYLYAEARQQSKPFSGPTANKTKPNFRVMKAHAKVTDDEALQLSKVYPILKRVASEFQAGDHPLYTNQIPVHFGNGFNYVTKTIARLGIPGSEAALRSPTAAMAQATRLDHRIPEAEPVILKNLSVAINYAVKFNFRWPALEKKIRNRQALYGPLWDYEGGKRDQYGRSMGLTWIWDEYKKRMGDLVDLGDELSDRLDDLDKP